MKTQKPKMYETPKTQKSCKGQKHCRRDVLTVDETDYGKSVEYINTRVSLLQIQGYLLIASAFY